MRKDTLAAGAKSAKFAGGSGDTDIFRNLSKEERVDEVIDMTPAPIKRKFFAPIGRVILVRRTEETSYSGALVLPDSKDKEVPAQGTILSVGFEVEYGLGAGDVIAFGKYAGTTFRLNGEELLLMNQDDVLGVIRDEDDVVAVPTTGGDLGVGGCIVGRA